MSSSQGPISSEEAFSDQTVKDILSLAHEPSYISEIARKLKVSNSELSDRSHKTIVEIVAKIVFVLNEEDRISVQSVGYEENDGQVESSPKVSLVGDSDEAGIEKWEQYKLIYDPDIDFSETRSEIKEIADTSVTVADKVAMINTLSGVGNDVSKDAENILQDCLDRQFADYSLVEKPDYNHPGVDFYVEDDDRRDYGLCVEISTRWVNPIGKPYVDKKSDIAIDRDSDLVVLAPSFTNQMLNKHENPDNPRWHSDVGNEIVHLHRVPNRGPETYRPFAKRALEDDFDGNSGNPIIIPDEERVRERLEDRGRVGEDYPVVDSEHSDYATAVRDVYRDAVVIEESQYRNQIREAIEPVLGNFMRPYRIEQFLIDMYWDKGLTQSEIGSLVDKSGGTIGDWMADDKWNIITRGSGAPELDGETVEIWQRMYLGLEPFVDEDGEPIQHSGYRIQAEYNRNPLWGLDDWEEWYQNTTEEERLERMTKRDDYRDNIDYTIMLNPENRLQPSYSFILNRLKQSDIDIREPDKAPRVPYAAYSNRTTMDTMLNRNAGTFEIDSEGEELVTQEDVEVFDSYFEVDVATWLSKNDITYAHEPFTIPSMAGPSRERWDKMVKAVRQVGRGEEVGFEDFSAFEIQNMWSSIYDKHQLQDETVFVPVLDSLAKFAKNFVLPDLVVYNDVDSSPKPMDWSGWNNWDSIIEVSGLYGVGIPEDSDEEEWFDWYRVAGVAFKEFAYKLLGLWDDVYYIVPNQPKIEGVSAGIPNELRDDDHYIIVNTTSTEINLSELAVEMGISAGVVESGLSPPIQPTEYNRPHQGADEITTVEWEFDGLNLSQVPDFPDAFMVDDEWIVYDGSMGDVYVSDGSVHVRASQWSDENMLILREYVLDVVRDLSENNIISEVERK